MTTLHLRNSIGRSPLLLGFLLVPLALTWLALSPVARAVCREGCDLTLQSTFLGEAALESNTSGDNTAIGFHALRSNTIGFANTAVGAEALSSHIQGVDNTAIGTEALFTNNMGFDNTGIGAGALYSNTTGFANTATGGGALRDNMIGNNNTATGGAALFHNTGGNNTANGYFALESNTTGGNNIALGFQAGLNLTTGDNNIDIGNAGAADESDTIRIGVQGIQTRTFIAGISGISLGNGVAVRVNANGRLGTAPSSARFKDSIKPMDKASEVIHVLKPVSFRYKKEIDPDGVPQFGLVAEDVEKVNPDLVARDTGGKAYTVRYEAVNAMLLNEFLKEHRTVQEQAATIAELKKGLGVVTARLKEQEAQIQKVSAELEVSKPTPQIFVNDQ